MHYGVWQITLIVLMVSLVDAGHDLDESHPGTFNGSPRDLELVRTMIRFIKRGASKHNNPKDWHTQRSHRRLKRGWIREDPLNRATESPTSTSTTLPPPNINPNLTRVPSVTIAKEQNTPLENQTTPIQITTDSMGQSTGNITETNENITETIETTTETNDTVILRPFWKLHVFSAIVTLIVRTCFC